MAANSFGNLVKVVVDVENGIMAVDAEIHSDEETLLLITSTNPLSNPGKTIFSPSIIWQD